MPFNIACGRCRNCKERKTGICLNTNPERPGAAYGYVDMGGWPGGQARYVMVPYADFNCLKFQDKDQAMEKILDLTMLSDIFPTGYHGCVTAGVTTGSTVYVAGAGPVGLAAAHSAQLLGAAVVIVGDLIPERLEQARSFGCETIDVSKGDPEDQIAAPGEERAAINPPRDPEVDAGVDAVGFEARGHGEHADEEVPATVLNSLMDLTRAGGALGIPGLYVTGDPGAQGRRRPAGLAVDPHRPGLGEVPPVHDGPVPGHEVPPRAHGWRSSTTAARSPRRSTRASSRSTTRRRATRTSTTAHRVKYVLEPARPGPDGVVGHRGGGASAPPPRATPAPPPRAA